MECAFTPEQKDDARIRPAPRFVQSIDLVARVLSGLDRFALAGHLYRSRGRSPEAKLHAYARGRR